MFDLIFTVAWFGATVGLIALFDKRHWRPASVGNRTYQAASWALVAIGMLQTIFTPLRYQQFSEEALWFGAAGLGVTLGGVVNVLNLATARADTALRRVCLGANIGVSAVFVAVATHRGAEFLHDPISALMVAAAVAATVLCTRQRPVVGRQGLAS